MSNESTTNTEASPAVASTSSEVKKKGGLGKILLIGCGLLFLCFFLCGIFFVLFGYIETNEECQYRGPLAPESDYCKDEDKDSKKDDKDNDSKDKDVVSEDDEDIEPVVRPDSDLETYDGIYYTMDYPSDWTYEESFTDSKVSFTAPNGSDNLILNEVYDNEFTVSNANCSDYADALVDGLASLYEETDLEDYSVAEIGGGEACRVELTGVLGGVELNQVQYYVLDTVFDSYAYILTLTANSNSSMQQMESMVDSFEIL